MYVGRAEGGASAAGDPDGLCGQVFGPQSPDQVPEQCQIGGIDRAVF
jgi:hypothetical protein